MGSPLPIVRESLGPPGGWHYPQDNFRIVSKVGSFKDLIQCVMEHRLANAKPVGDPLSDVTNYICATFPHLCQTPGAIVGTQTRISAAPHVPRNMNPLQILIDALTAWGHKIARVNAAIELPEEAKRRETICLKCPLNVPWEHGCSPCVNTANRVFFLIRRSKNTPKQKKLGACKINQHCNRTAVWLDRRHLQKRKGSHPTCWI